MIQLYVKTSDLRQTEGLTSPNNDYDLRSRTTVLKWFNQYSLDGIIDNLKCMPNGIIVRGNTRYLWAKYNVLEYLPIDLGFFLGLITTTNGILLRQSILSEQYKASEILKSTPIKPPNQLIHNLADFWNSESNSYDIPIDDIFEGFTLDTV